MLQSLLNQITTRSFASRLVVVALVLASVRGSAQDPPKPPQPKPTPPPATTQSGQKKTGPVRQGAQADQQPTETISDAIKFETELVLLDVSVVDENNTPVFSLSKEEFAVYEDRVKQELDNVSREEVPLSFGVVIDTSGSMRSKLQIVTDAGLSLIKQMRPDD